MKRGEPLHPAIDGDVINLGTALSQQLFSIAIGQLLARVPAYRDHDPSGGNRNPANPDLGVLTLGQGDDAS